MIDSALEDEKSHICRSGTVASCQLLLRSVVACLRRNHRRRECAFSNSEYDL